MWAEDVSHIAMLLVQLDEDGATSVFCIIPSPHFVSNYSYWSLLILRVVFF